MTEKQEKMQPFYAQRPRKIIRPLLSHKVSYLVESMADTKNEGFDLQMVKECFEAAKLEQNEILIDKYLEGFKEIDRFFRMMGTLFSFIAKDITSKSAILREHKAENPDQFTSVQSMLEYEASNDLTKSKTKSGLLSGSRTFLRLHRSLLFFAKFLEKVPGIEDDAPCSGVASEVYGETLGKYHPWLIRQAAYLAMRSLPIKRVLIEDYIKQSHEEAQELVPVLVKAMLDVYDIVQTLYKEKDLLQLP